MQENGIVLTSEDMLRWLKRAASVLHEQRDYLTQLDAAIGDADHGINMDRGFQAVNEKLAGLADADSGTILKTVGMTLVSTVGGASGPLYGTAFLRAASATGGKRELQAADVIAMLEAMLEGIKARGKAQQGEKTMIDALAPALEAAHKAQEERLDLPDILRRCSEAAEQGVKDTVEMVATKGRASYLGERSRGHQDPGATSCWLLLAALADR